MGRNSKKCPYQLTIKKQNVLIYNDDDIDSIQFYQDAFYFFHCPTHLFQYTSKNISLKS